MLNWGVLGTGRIAQKVVPLIHCSQNHTFMAAASRSTEPAVQFADTYNLKMAFDTYEELIHHPEIDAIYIATPNSTHFELAKKSLLAGKHVLCEKPLVMSATEALELRDLASAQQKHLAEGFMYRHHLQTLTVLKLLQEKTYGKVLHAQGSFHFHLFDQSNIRLKKAEGGGALRDIGCYLINFMTAIFN